MATATVTFTFAPNLLIKSSEANTNFQDLVTFLNTQTMHRDASSAFTNVPSGPAVDATSDNQLVRKAMLDKRQALCVNFVNGIVWGSSGAYSQVTTFTNQIAQPGGTFTATGSSIKILRAGWYAIGAQLTHVTLNSVGLRGLRIVLNGTSTFIEDVNAGFSNPFTCSPFGEIPYQAAVNDEFTLFTQQDSGVNSSLYARLWVKGLAWT